MTKPAIALYVLFLLASALVRSAHDFITQAVLGHSPLNPKELS